MTIYGGWVLTPARFLTDEEVARLRKNAVEKAKASRWRRRSKVLEWIVVEIALHTGLRLSEAAGLRCGDLCLGPQGGSVLVRMGKGGKSRVVKFGLGFGQSLIRYLAWKRKRGERVNGESPLLVSSHTGGHLSRRALQKMFERVARDAGIEGHRFHDLRHTHASHLYRASGNNLRLVQKQLGHASIRTTEIYADVLDGEAEKAVNKLFQ